MSVIPAGTTLDYAVTYLEMTEQANLTSTELPKGTRLEQAHSPPNWVFLSLYDAVGRDYEWVDWHSADPADLTAYLTDPRVETWVAYAKGWPQGFFQLDFREGGTCDLAYFGLVPEAIGGGLGRALLLTAIQKAWNGNGVTRVTVNTCSLDHPRAVGLYKTAGFRAFRREEKSRVLVRPRDPSNFP